MNLLRKKPNIPVKAKPLACVNVSTERHHGKVMRVE